MPTVSIFAVATTTAGTPRVSPSVNYSGTSNTTVMIQPVCPTWATADPTQVVKISVQQSFDGGVSWGEFCVLETLTRKVNRAGQLPSTTCQHNDTFGVRPVRAVLTVSVGSLDIGVDATV